MKHSVPFRLVDPADGASSVRRWAVATLLAGSLAISTGFASAQEAGTATPTVIASATADTTATTAPNDTATAVTTPTTVGSTTPVTTETAVATTTPVASATATPVGSATPAASATVVGSATPEDRNVERLVDDLNELETTLGSRLSDDTRAQITRVRNSLAELLEFSSGIQAGTIAPSKRVRAQFEDLAHDLRRDLNGLKHEVQDDIHDIAKNGGGLAMAGIQHDLKLIKNDVDIVIREEKHELKVTLHNGRRNEDEDEDRARPTTIAGTLTPAASPTAGTTPISGTPTAVAKVDDDDDHKSTGRSKRRDHDEDEDKNRERERAPSLPPVVALLPIQGLPVPFLPAITRVQPAARKDSDEEESSRGRKENQAREREVESKRELPKQAEVKTESKREEPKQPEVKNESKREAPKQAEVRNESKREAPKQESAKAAAPKNSGGGGKDKR